METNATNNNKVVFKEISYKLCGLCFKVHNQLGRFRNEKQYADALESLLKKSGVKYKREYVIPISFSGEAKGRSRTDFLIEDSLLLDLKAKRIVTKEDYFQMQRYLVSSSKKLGIIVNFRQKFLSPKRILA